MIKFESMFSFWYYIFKCLLGNSDLYFKLKWLQIRTYETQTPWQDYIWRFNLTNTIHELDQTTLKFFSRMFLSRHCGHGVLEDEDYPNRHASFFQTCHIQPPDWSHCLIIESLWPSWIIVESSWPTLSHWDGIGNKGLEYPSIRTNMPEIDC